MNICEVEIVSREITCDFCHPCLIVKKGVMWICDFLCILHHLSYERAKCKWPTFVIWGIVLQYSVGWDQTCLHFESIHHLKVYFFLVSYILPFGWKCYTFAESCLLELLILLYYIQNISEFNMILLYQRFHDHFT